MGSAIGLRPEPGRGRRPADAVWWSVRRV